jgi:hypothetical protein
MKGGDCRAGDDPRIVIHVGTRTIVYDPPLPPEIARLKARMIEAARRWAKRL